MKNENKFDDKKFLKVIVNMFILTRHKTKITLLKFMEENIVFHIFTAIYFTVHLVQSKCQRISLPSSLLFPASYAIHLNVSFACRVDFSFQRQEGVLNS